ncbi:MAG: hypothetical protein HY659_12850 [Rhizobiales bacterium]|nr:hypothetical protein [Hyphomicrobiales bacterium]
MPKRPRATFLIFVSLVVATLLGLADSLPAQPAPPADWCMRWTDNCTMCQQTKDKAEATCSTKSSTCRTGPVRCLSADTAALKAACEKWNSVRDNSCNVCSKPDAQGRRMCTLKGCPPREIVCLVPRP